MAPIPRCDLRLPNEPRIVKRAKRSSSDAHTPTVDDETQDDADDSTPQAAHSRHTRDSAEIIENASEFSTRLTRDQGEIREHHASEDASHANVGDGCATLEECRARWSVASDYDDAPPPQTHSDEIDKHSTATPGDVCAQFCHNRAESPSSDMYELIRSGGGKKTSAELAEIEAKRKRVVCKGTYRSRETYTLFWGSSRAVGAHKKLELEMKKRRKFLEKLHERNRRRRENERHRAKEKRRMLRCRDQAKIPETKDDISINKAFCFRFNYNKRLPFMPSTMGQHFRKYNKPPFKNNNYSKHLKPCVKHVDEFQKLRVTEAQIKEMAESKKAKFKGRERERSRGRTRSRSRGRSARKKATKGKAGRVAKKIKH